MNVCSTLNVILLLITLMSITTVLTAQLHSVTKTLPSPTILIKVRIVVSFQFDTRFLIETTHLVTISITTELLQFSTYCNSDSLIHMFSNEL